MNRVNRLILSTCLPLILSNPAHAFSWQNLWKTPDQQAQQLMDKAQYKQASKKFDIADWQATANYRAGNYQSAAKQFASLDNEQGYYNQGNALAHTGEYEQAIKAYDKALKLNPNNKDAKFNRDLLKKLLEQQKKQQQNQNQQNNKQDKNKQDKNKQDKNKQDKNKQDKNKQDKNKQDKNKQDKNKQDKNKQDKNKQDKNKQDKNKQDKNKQDKKNRNKQQQRQNAANKPMTQQQKEQQQAKQQWLKQVPDDPGGLLKQKFLRDYLKRHRGWQR